MKKNKHKKTEDNNINFSKEFLLTSKLEPLQISMCGHTSVGKTVWLQSLFNEEIVAISPNPNTTTDVKTVSIHLSSVHVADFHDVPGNNYSAEILEDLKENYGEFPSIDQIKQHFSFYKQRNTTKFLNDVRLYELFLTYDVLLFVVDCSTGPSDDTLSEFKMLQRLGKPVVVILNFTNSYRKDRDDLVPQWKQAFKAEGQPITLDVDAFERNWLKLDALGKEISRLLTHNDHPDAELRSQLCEYVWNERVMARHLERERESIHLLATELVNLSSYMVRGKAHNSKDIRNKRRELVKSSNKLLGDSVLHFFLFFGKKYPFISEIEKREISGDTEEKVKKLLKKSYGKGAAVGAVIGFMIGFPEGGIAAPPASFLGLVVGGALDALYNYSIKKSKAKDLNTVIKVSFSERTLKKFLFLMLPYIVAYNRVGSKDMELDHIRSMYKFSKAKLKSVLDWRDIQFPLDKVKAKPKYSEYLPGYNAEKVHSRRTAVIEEITETLLFAVKQTNDALDNRKSSLMSADEMKDLFLVKAADTTAPAKEIVDSGKRKIEQVTDKVKLASKLLKIGK